MDHVTPSTAKNRQPHPLTSFAVWTALLTAVGFPVSVQATRAQIQVHIDPATNPWTRLDFNDDPANFQFAIVADRTGGARPGVFEEAIRKINLLHPEFVMSVGDLIQGGIEDVHEINYQWDELAGFVHELEMPFFFVPGNHDISNLVMARIWRERFGRSYYHFVYRNVLFLCLNTEDPPRSQMSQDQADYVARALEEHPDVRWTLVFLHKPMWTYEEDTGWSRIEDQLEGRKYTVFAGHTHDYTKYVRNDSRYLVLATTGGGSGLRGPLFGEFDHLVWVTMTDDGPIVANLMLDGLWDENIRDEETADLVAGILRGGVVTGGSLVLDQLSFRESSTHLRLENNADVPMDISLEIAGPGPFEISPATLEMSLPPNSMKTAIFHLKLGRTVPVPLLPPIQSNWSAVYRLPDHDPVELTGVHPLVIDAVMPCPVSTDPIQLDGDLTDWSSLPLECAQPAQIRNAESDWKGPKDASFRFGVKYDEQYLYLALRAQDDSLIFDPVRKGWDRDGFEVRLDARPDPVRSRSRGRPSGAWTGEFEGFLWLTLSPGEEGHPMWFQARDVLPEGSQAAWKAVESGFAIEVSIPIQYLNEKQGGEWEAFRLNINQNDRDHEGGVSKLYWRPDWRTDATYHGSGTFRRSGS